MDKPPEQKCLVPMPDATIQNEATKILRAWYVSQADKINLTLPAESFFAPGQIVSNISLLLSGGKEYFGGTSLHSSLQEFERNLKDAYPSDYLAMFTKNHITILAEAVARRVEIQDREQVRKRQFERWEVATKVVRVLSGLLSHAALAPCQIAVAFFMMLDLISIGDVPLVRNLSTGKKEDRSVIKFADVAVNELRVTLLYLTSQRNNVASFLKEKKEYTDELTDEKKEYTDELTDELLEKVRKLMISPLALINLVPPSLLRMLDLLQSLIVKASGENTYIEKIIKPWITSQDDPEQSEILWNRAVQIVRLAVKWIPLSVIKPGIDLHADPLDLSIALTTMEPSLGPVQPTVASVVLAFLSSDEGDITVKVVWDKLHDEFIVPLLKLTGRDVIEGSLHSETSMIGKPIHMFGPRTLQLLWKRFKTEFLFLLPESLQKAISYWQREKPKWIKAVHDNLDRLSRVKLPSTPEQRKEARSLFLSLGIFINKHDRVIQPGRDAVNYLKRVFKEAPKVPTGEPVGDKNQVDRNALRTRAATDLPIATEAEVVNLVVTVEEEAFDAGKFELEERHRDLIEEFLQQQKTLETLRVQLVTTRKEVSDVAHKLKQCTEEMAQFKSAEKIVQMVAEAEKELTEVGNSLEKIEEGVRDTQRDTQDGQRIVQNMPEKIEAVVQEHKSDLLAEIAARGEEGRLRGLRKSPGPLPPQAATDDIASAIKAAIERRREAMYPKKGPTKEKFSSFSLSSSTSAIQKAKYFSSLSLSSSTPVIQKAKYEVDSISLEIAHQRLLIKHHTRAKNIGTVGLYRKKLKLNTLLVKRAKKERQLLCMQSSSSSYDNIAVHNDTQSWINSVLLFINEAYKNSTDKSSSSPQSSEMVINARSECLNNLRQLVAYLKPNEKARALMDTIGNEIMDYVQHGAFSLIAAPDKEEEAQGISKIEKHLNGAFSIENIASMVSGFDIIRLPQQRKVAVAWFDMIMSMASLASTMAAMTKAGALSNASITHAAVEFDQKSREFASTVARSVYL